jgi:hypothetical protein
VSPTTSPWIDIASAAPLAATARLGLGPFRGYTDRTGDLSALSGLAKSHDSAYVAANCAGSIGTQLLSVLSFHGGSVTREVLAAETAGAVAADIDGELDRLVRAGLVEGANRGAFRLTPGVKQILVPIGRTFGEQYAVSTEEVAGICKNLGVSPIPSRKQERIDAIAECFADTASAARVRDSLSKAARSILEEVAQANGPDVVDARRVGLDLRTHRWVDSWSFSGERSSGIPADLSQQADAVAELGALGIMGTDEWEGTVWIWGEAWPLLQRPLFTTWPSVGPPDTAPVTATELRMPALVATFDRALRHWDQSPPAVLKSGEMRLGKPALRSTAKALGVDEATVEIIANTALSLGLLLANVVAASGRGRKRTVEEKWLIDPELQAAWSASSPTARWLRIVAEWVNPTSAVGSEQLVAARHLLLWELAALDEDLGWTDDTAVGTWMEHRYAPMAVSEAITECLTDLRLLGVVHPSGPVALTEIGRIALEDPAAVGSLEFGTAREAIVQADMSIICPPDMDMDLLTRIEALATLDSDHGTRTYTLEESLIVDAVRAGDSAEGITTFLDELSSVPLPDTVYRLVCDAAQRVGQVRVAPASSVLVTEDPVDLATACKLKSAKLTALTATVAVSSLSPEKLIQILDRKGLAPTITAGDGDTIVRRSASAEAAELERRAEQHREIAKRTGIKGLAAQADLFEREAAAARNPGSRLAVSGPLAVTPALLQKVGK